LRNTALKDDDGDDGDDDGLKTDVESCGCPIPSSSHHMICFLFVM
jgi:hypothetical protein